MSWLVTGGAGYIGSHIVDYFFRSNESIVVLDNLISGSKTKIEGKCTFIEGDISDVSNLQDIFQNHEIEGVINLAALKSVSESALIPDEYKRINSTAAANLVFESVRHGVDIFVQSSTAAVYGNLDSGVAREDSKLTPISVYGKTKVEAEIALSHQIEQEKIKGVSLRYFNVVGAQNEFFKDTSKANLFPIVMEAIKHNQAPQIFGADYPTPDGTCIRDYVHVQDIARAHYLAADALRKRQTSVNINVGAGHGYSVREVMTKILRHQSSGLAPIVLPRRQGDPAQLVAEVQLAEKELGFRAEFGLDAMVESTFF
jgi:UDP-glucose 4-epimerase